MRAGIEERAQPCGGQRNRVRPRDTDGVKTLRAGKCGKRRFERGRI
jgi:hypothetical protein